MKSTSKEGKNVERQWRHIPGFSRYMASDTGVVIGMSRQSVMTPYKNKKGYLILTPRNDDWEASVYACSPFDLVGFLMARFQMDYLLTISTTIQGIITFLTYSF